MKHNISNKPRFLLVQVTPSLTPKETVKADLTETKQLIDTFGGEVFAEIIQYRNRPDPNFYLGSGKVEDLKQKCKDNKIDFVVINNLIKSGQIFRLEKALWEVSHHIMVWDRIDLILNIFDQHASTVESKLQIKLAKATHMGPRIYGLGKTELSRQGGGIGTRGKGETNIEFERRKIKVDKQKIQKELKKLIKQKHSRLKKRKELGIGPVALVGYTSAGKTTLFNTLTGKQKEINQDLFTTLDTVVGKLKTPHLDQPVLISDTIGFINNLPPILIDSFKSTLLESLEAKLLIHVVDTSDPRIFEKIQIVEDILDQLKATQPRIIALNKIDLMEEKNIDNIEKEIRLFFENKVKVTNLSNIIHISAKSSKNIDLLKDKISGFFVKKKPGLYTNIS